MVHAFLKWEFDLQEMHQYFLQRGTVCGKWKLTSVNHIYTHPSQINNGELS